MYVRTFPFLKKCLLRILTPCWFPLFINLFNQLITVKSFIKYVRSHCILFDVRKTCFGWSQYYRGVRGNIHKYLHKYKPCHVSFLMHFFSQIRQLTTRWTLLSFSPPDLTHIARVPFNFCYNI